ncbi:hypothetical protein TR74_07560 [Carbonactinospora thermoautotrophica]|uniref:Uncharacterized protein n=1 Tax=Carbonactinospora thermoautotrophica TaxID=1469144 RepID=A0A132NI43_9ACTN|nr:hypothetical protein TR74_07560 [Carbonactinospora thermoautotrophica]
MERDCAPTVTLTLLAKSVEVADQLFADARFPGHEREDLEDREDAAEADAVMARLEAGEEKTVSHEEAWRRLDEAAEKAPNHPALRWRLADGSCLRQHRRNPETGGTVCGIPGPLELADTTAERCYQCWT